MKQNQEKKAPTEIKKTIAPERCAQMIASWQVKYPEEFNEFLHLLVDHFFQSIEPNPQTKKTRPPA
jgi:hypothetical protein